MRQPVGEHGLPLEGLLCLVVAAVLIIALTAASPSMPCSSNLHLLDAVFGLRTSGTARIDAHFLAANHSALDFSEPRFTHLELTV